MTDRAKAACRVRNLDPETVGELLTRQPRLHHTRTIRATPMVRGREPRHPPVEPPFPHRRVRPVGPSRGSRKMARRVALPCPRPSRGPSRPQRRSHPRPRRAGQAFRRPRRAGRVFRRPGRRRGAGPPALRAGRVFPPAVSRSVRRAGTSRWLGSDPSHRSVRALRRRRRLDGRRVRPPCPVSLLRRRRGRPRDRLRPATGPRRGRGRCRWPS
jgi:hypothetical protein